jgi:hypothetical protein
MRHLIKRLAGLAATTIPIYAMLTVFMPPGFAGVPWMLLILGVFAALFVALLFFEESPVWNGLIAFCFWLPMIFIHLAEPGIDTIANGTVFVGVLEILGIAEVHGFSQYALRRALNCSKSFALLNNRA